MPRTLSSGQTTQFGIRVGRNRIMSKYVLNVKYIFIVMHWHQQKDTMDSI